MTVFIRPLDPRDGNEWECLGNVTAFSVTVAEPPVAEQQAPEEEDDRVFCHLLTAGDVPVCGASVCWGTYLEHAHSETQNGHCVACGLPRCPACMEFVT